MNSRLDRFWFFFFFFYFVESSRNADSDLNEIFTMASVSLTSSSVSIFFPLRKWTAQK